MKMDDCTTTTRGGHLVTPESLQKMLRGLPEPPTMYAMEYKMFEIIPNRFLPDNTIIISMDLAEKMGWAGKEQ